MAKESREEMLARQKKELAELEKKERGPAEKIRDEGEELFKRLIEEGHLAEIDQTEEARQIVRLIVAVSKV